MKVLYVGTVVAVSQEKKMFHFQAIENSVLMGTTIDTKLRKRQLMTPRQGNG